MRLPLSKEERLHLCVATALVSLLILVPRSALAAPIGGAVMPWTGPLQNLLGNLSGPTARVLGALAFVVGGALWAFTRHEEGAKRFGQAIIGIAIMIGAANIVATLGFVGATL
jgi:type IV secretory pathway VirB2 component (pilin)